jgi:hypothetical protein
VRRETFPVTPTTPHHAATEKKAIALSLLGAGPVGPKDLAKALPPSVGAGSKKPEVRRLWVAGDMLRALEQEGLARGPDADGKFRAVQA